MIFLYLAIARLEHKKKHHSSTKEDQVVQDDSINSKPSQLSLVPNESVKSDGNKCCLNSKASKAVDDGGKCCFNSVKSNTKDNGKCCLNSVKLNVSDKCKCCLEPKQSNTTSASQLISNMFNDDVANPNPAQSSNLRPRLLQDGFCRVCHGQHRSCCFANSTYVRGENNYERELDKYDQLTNPEYLEYMARSRIGHRRNCYRALLDPVNWGIIMNNNAKRGKFGCQKH